LTSISPYVIKLDCLYAVSSAVSSSSPPQYATPNSFSAIIWGAPVSLWIYQSCFWTFSHLRTFSCKFYRDIRQFYWSRFSITVHCFHPAIGSWAEFQKWLRVRQEGGLAAGIGKDS
jgi:hypothetical protein